MTVLEATADAPAAVQEQPAIKIGLLDKSAAWLDGRQRNDTSQFGEDGLIQAVFDRIGTTNQWCFEVGAADGLFFSNTKRLRDAGWRAVLIESDPVSVDKCRAFANERVQVIQETIKRDSLDNILAGCGAPIRMDLGIIDIDGQDYWAWEGLKAFRPRVMLVEFTYVNDDFLPQPGATGQAGINPILALGKSKGYTALARTYCNVLFVDSQCL